VERPGCWGLATDEIRSAVLLGLLGWWSTPICPTVSWISGASQSPTDMDNSPSFSPGIGFRELRLLKVYGTRGVYMSAFLGGFVNSSAAAVETGQARGAGGTSPGVAVAALLLTIVAMFARKPPDPRPLFAKRRAQPLPSPLCDEPSSR